MNRYSINICDDASHSLSINDAKRLNECDQNDIQAVSIEIINAHIKTLIDTGRAFMLSRREYSVESYTDEYHLTFTLRDDSNDDELNDDEFEQEQETSFIASFQII